MQKRLGLPQFIVLLINPCSFNHRPVFVSASCSADMSIKLWNFEAFECIKTLRGHDHNISSIAFTANGDFLVSASRDKSIKIWEVATGFNVKTITGHADWVRKARPSPDGHWLCSVGNDQSVRLWNYSNQELRFDLRDHSHVVEYVSWAPGSAHAAIVEMSQAEVSSMAHVFFFAGLLLSCFYALLCESHFPMYFVSFMQSNGPFFATASRDKSIKLFDASTGQCLHTFVMRVFSNFSSFSFFGARVLSSSLITSFCFSL